MAASSIFRASQTGDILRVKELIGRGFPVNRPNAYGCIALHYAAKSAAECATVVARGGDEPGADEAKVLVTYNVFVGEGQTSRPKQYPVQLHAPAAPRLAFTNHATIETLTCIVLVVNDF